MNKSLSMILALALVSAGCATTNPYTGESQMSKTAMGTGLGALAGAGIGALATKNRGTGALIGAAAGAALGGGVGYYMDRQEEKLRSDLQGTGIDVQRQGDNILLNMPNQVTFAFDSSELTGTAISALNSVAGVLNQYPETTIDVVGHTDAIGTDAYNQGLSERRAKSVADYLTSQGVAAQRMASRGMGEKMPIASNDSEAGRAQNRRVEIAIRPTANVPPAPQGTAPQGGQTYPAQGYPQGGQPYPGQNYPPSGQSYPPQTYPNYPQGGQPYPNYPQGGQTYPGQSYPTYPPRY
ncbi:MAG: OmpA family protein [Gammaproteobacteria bacterium]